jgi:4-oxalocrotonate tautomerase
MPAHQAATLTYRPTLELERWSCGTPAREKAGRKMMPEIVVYALGGRSLDQKRGLMKDITEAVVKNYKVEPSAVVVTLVESEKMDKMKGGVLFSEAGQHK